MESKQGENLSGAKRRLLEQLKRGGSATVSGLAAVHGSTEVAVRQHLRALEQQGWVRRAKSSPRGRGRPSEVWALSEAAAELFPDRHGELTIDLIDGVREAFGEQGLERLIEIRSQAQERRYRRLMRSSTGLGEKLDRLAEERSREGYMAIVVREPGGSFLLIESHCPICAAARACSGLCRGELRVFQQVLGPAVQVERVRHLLAGSDRCSYRVTDLAPRPSHGESANSSVAQSTPRG